MRNSVDRKKKIQIYNVIRFFFFVNCAGNCPYCPSPLCIHHCDYVQYTIMIQIFDFGIFVIKYLVFILQNYNCTALLCPVECGPTIERNDRIGIGQKSYELARQQTYRIDMEFRRRKYSLLIRL